MDTTTTTTKTSTAANSTPSVAQQVNTPVLCKEYLEHAHFMDIIITLHTHNGLPYPKEASRKMKGNDARNTKNHRKLDARPMYFGMSLAHTGTIVFKRCSYY